MPPIFITALITDGSSLIFVGSRDPNARLLLPRYPFGEDEVSLEESLERRLRLDLGIIVTEQEFVDTVYERTDDPAGVVLNNLQLVTGWEGITPGATAAGAPIVLVSLEDVPDIDLPPELRDPLLAAIGLSPVPSGSLSADAGKAGHVILLSGGDDEMRVAVARALGAFSSRSAHIPVSALRAMSGGRVTAGGSEDVPADDALVYRNAAALTRNYAGEGYNCVIDIPVLDANDAGRLLWELAELAVYAVRLADDRDGAFDFGALGTLAPGLVVNASGADAELLAEGIVEQLDDARIQ